jgi:peptidyl-tRNA hydrolase
MSLQSQQQVSNGINDDRGSNNNNDQVIAAGDKDPTKSKTLAIVQYIFLRRDLAIEWPAGALAAQAAHASLAAVTQALGAQHEPARQYVSPQNLAHMTKQVYGVDNDMELERVRQAWRKHIVSSTTIEKSNSSAPNDDAEPQETTTNNSGGGEVGLYVWMEQPENIPTAMATWPVVRTNKVSKVIKSLKLSYF